MLKTLRARGWGAVLVVIASFIFRSVATADDNAITADPPVPRPDSTPCVVQLFAGMRFDNYSSKFFDYAPPGGCPGPWAKVVLEADFSVTAGRQFDRTAIMWIGGTNIYFGTTQEPSATVSPSWHIERDLTDYSPLFTVPRAGRIDLFNVVNQTYTGILFGNATLQFYPLEHREDAPVTADVVLPLSAVDTGGTVSLETFDSVLERSFTLPTNIERAYLDIVAESQAGDEFWMLCVPDEVRGRLRSCGGTGFRETEIAIDGIPAGVAPVYPWIYTGGIDPYLWRPIPGVQTLNFVPYRVDLTPFAGLLSDGRTHSVAIRVFNANHRFEVTGAVLLYLDRGSRQVRGAVTRNTLSAAPTPVAEVDVRTVDGVTSGTVVIRSSRLFEIAGVVHTSHGTVHTRVEQNIQFSSEQAFDNITATSFSQNLNQMTTISSQTTVRGDENDDRGNFRRFEWPLTLSFSITPRADGLSARRTVIRQEYHDRETSAEDDDFSGEVSSVVTPRDTLLVRGGSIVGHEDQFSAHEYFSRGSEGACYSRRITAVGGLVTEIVDGERCHDR
jgi:hypothetical protein